MSSGESIRKTQINVDFFARLKIPPDLQRGGRKSPAHLGGPSKSKACEKFNFSWNSCKFITLKTGAWQTLLDEESTVNLVTTS